MKTFYMVWNPRTGRTAVRHGTLKSAADEAKRLAHLNPNQQFFVLESVGYATYTPPAPIEPPLKWESCEPTLEQLLQHKIYSPYPEL